MPNPLILAVAANVGGFFSANAKWPNALCPNGLINCVQITEKCLRRCMKPETKKNILAACTKCTLSIKCVIIKQVISKNKLSDL